MKKKRIKVRKCLLFLGGQLVLSQNWLRYHVQPMVNLLIYESFHTLANIYLLFIAADKVTECRGSQNVWCKTFFPAMNVKGPQSNPWNNCLWLLPSVEIKLFCTSWTPIFTFSLVNLPMWVLIKNQFVFVHLWHFLQQETNYFSFWHQK